MKKLLTPIFLLIVFNGYSIEKKEIKVSGELLRSSHETYPSSGVFVDSYTCKADPDKLCYTITIYKPGADSHAPYIVEDEISAYYNYFTQWHPIFGQL